MSSVNRESDLPLDELLNNVENEEHDFSFSDARPVSQVDNGSAHSNVKGYLKDYKTSLLQKVRIERHKRQ